MTHRYFRRLHMFSCFAALIFSALAHAQSTALELAAEIGITPESVTVAGLNDDAQLILQRLEASGGAQTVIATQQAAADALIQELRILCQQSWDDPSDSDVRAEESQKRQELAAVRQQIADSKQSLFNIVIDELDQDAVAKLIVFRDGAQYKVQAEFCVAERTHRQWKDIIRALRAIKRDASLSQEERDEMSERYSDDMNAHRALLAEIRADFDVVEATLNLQNNLANVEAVFAQFESQ